MKEKIFKVARVLEYKSLLKNNNPILLNLLSNAESDKIDNLLQDSFKQNLDYYKPHVSSLSKELLAEIKLKKIGTLAGYTVWLVDGNKIRDNADIEFCLAGNPSRYLFIPEGEIWIEVRSANDMIKDLIHEAEESILMKQYGKSYDNSHNAADYYEMMVRKGVVTKIDDKDYELAVDIANKFISAIKFENVLEKEKEIENKSNEISKEQLEKGKKVEMEHTDNPEIAEIIAKDHLKEMPGNFVNGKPTLEDLDYYEKLKIVEPENKSAFRKNILSKFAEEKDSLIEDLEENPIFDPELLIEDFELATKEWEYLKNTTTY